MADILSPSDRSRRMAAVRGKNTAPELDLRRWLHAHGFRYRLHSAKLPGRPDLVFPARKKVVFVNGCFWHRHEGCRLATTPKSSVDFWQAKFNANVARDRRQHEALRALGWEVLVVWQCELRDLERAGGRVALFLAADSD